MKVPLAPHVKFHLIEQLALTGDHGQQSYSHGPMFRLIDTVELTQEYGLTNFNLIDLVEQLTKNFVE